jgi:protein ImuB
MAQPRAPLALRFGPEIGRRLDQALGHVAEPIAPIRPAELTEVRGPIYYVARPSRVA